MLINTVILFLNDALPIIILIAILLAKTSGQSSNYTWLYQGLVLGVIATIILSLSLDTLAQLFNDTGMELLFSLAYLAIYSLIAVVFINEFSFKSSLLWYYSAATLVGLSLSFNGAKFLIYLIGYWSQLNAIQSLIIGCVLGAGICISIGILLYFIVVYCEQKNFSFVSSFLMLIFGAGQLIKSTNLLLQVDLLSSEVPLWDTNTIIKESSELGHFLTALLGYDASPSKLQFFIYLIAVILPLLILSLIRYKIKSKALRNNPVQEIF